MYLRTKLFSLLLAVSMILSLTACSGSADKEVEPTSTPETSNNTEASEPSDTTSDASSDSVLPDDFVADPDVEDLCLATAGFPGDFELLTINEQPVSARMYLYWLAYSISEMESNMYSYYGMPLDWSEEFGLGEYLMADALNATLMYTLIPNKAKELGYDLTADQVAEFDDYTAQTIEAMGGEEGFNESLRMLGLDRNTYLDINRTSYYYQQIRNSMFAGRPTDEDIKTYIEENDILSAKHILLLTIDMTTREPLADDVIAQKKATAEDILKQLQESDNLAADFDTLMQEYSEDSGLAANPNGYIFTAGEMVTEFEDGTRALEYGQISDIVESPYGYHIILRQNPDSVSLQEDCLTALTSDRINTWISEADVVFTEEYENLDPQLFYQKFMAYQAVFSATRQSAS